MAAAGRAGVLVVGASQAGVQLASSLRSFGYDRPITVVGAELHPPYQRPPLSKALLHGDVGTDSLLFRTPAFYEAERIDLVLGQRIIRIERGAEGAGVAFSESGAHYAFDRLALTVGARARRLTVPGASLAGISYLRDADDAMALRKDLDRSTDVVVVGGGFIGLEVAASARKQGKNVTVVLADPRLLGRAVGELTSSFFADAHLRRGVELHFGVSPTAFLDDGQGRVGAVELADGQVLKAELVIVGIGAVPRTELAEQHGLDIDNGIVVDEYGVASDGWTVAAGDCVNCPSPVPTGPARMRFESVNTAVEQAKTAAATLAGQRVPYRVPPWFWSDQFDVKLQVAGISAGHDHHVLRGDPAQERFSVLYYVENVLVSADCINSPVDFMAVRSALAAKRTVPPEVAADTSIPLKKLVCDVPRPELHHLNGVDSHPVVLDPAS